MILRPLCICWSLSEILEIGAQLGGDARLLRDVIPIELFLGAGEGAGDIETHRPEVEPQAGGVDPADIILGQVLVGAGAQGEETEGVPFQTEGEIAGVIAAEGGFVAGQV